MIPRQLEIPATEWRNHDISSVRDLLAGVVGNPALARLWRGSVVLTFAEVPEHNPYTNPAVADFFKNAYSEFPYLLYFLNPDPSYAMLDGYFASIGALCEDQAGVWIIWSDDVGTMFYRTLADAAEFAVRQGDDWVAVVKGYEYDERQTRFTEIRELLISRGVIWT